MPLFIRTNLLEDKTNYQSVSMSLVNSASRQNVAPACADPDGAGVGGQMSWTPLKNYKNIGFLSNTGSVRLYNHKTTKPPFNETPAGRW